MSGSETGCDYSSFRIAFGNTDYLWSMAEFNYDELRNKLNASGTWPQVYMFKFIVPSDNQKIAQTESLFEDDAEIKLQPSSTGKYTSITARVVMMDAEQIINTYKKAAHIEGIISL
jgi:uncharacterized protein